MNVSARSSTFFADVRSLSVVGGGSFVFSRRTMLGFRRFAVSHLRTGFAAKPRLCLDPQPRGYSEAVPASTTVLLIFSGNMGCHTITSLAVCWTKLVETI